ncbi:MAG: hypothetical protein DRQ40_03210 [Gammaproteobacteria bacterium]|nr:MAG: hypothetical protein DRQ40_03210 [Gammaproteobacteria bacterium]
MPRSRQPLHRNDLPRGYKNLEPENGFPISPQIKSKDKICWHCLECGDSHSLSIDNIFSSPSRKQACKTCDKGEQFRNLLKDHKSGIELVNWQFDSLNQYANTSNPSFAITYTLKCLVSLHPCYKLSGSKIESAVYGDFNAPRIACPCCKVRDRYWKDRAKYEEYRNNNELLDQLLISWPNASCRYRGYSKLNNNSSPPSHLYSIKTKLRQNQKALNDESLITTLNGPPTNHLESFREKINGVFTIEKIDQKIAQYWKDIELLQEAMLEATHFGAEILEVKHPSAGQLYFKYMAAAGFISVWQTRVRAGETAWGRTAMSQGEAYLFATVKLLFPYVERWEFNSRDKIAGTKLELDLGTQELIHGGLWLEYQGDDSHRKCPETMKRDKQKKEKSPGVLIVIDRIKGYTGVKFLDAVKEGLQQSKAAHLLEQMEEINSDQIDLLATKIIYSKADEIGRRLEKLLYEKNPKHKINTPLNKIFSSGRYSYSCGLCNKDVVGVMVKHHLDRPPSGCRNCRTERRHLE